MPEREIEKSESEEIRRLKELLEKERVLRVQAQQVIKEKENLIKEKENQIKKRKRE